MIDSSMLLGGKYLPLDADDPVTAGQAPPEAEFLFCSAEMQAVYDLATQIAPSDACVLISGETGTGKELLAQCIHNLSRRRKKPFVPVNCGVLKGELFADKFFGHEAGAFTGAAKLSRGIFEMAGDGTLFLDEVGEIPGINQVDFLRVLEERSFRRLGGERPIRFAARIVAATNRTLTEMVRQGAFRADLYYRLNVVPLVLPPLRKRSGDIVFLAEYFLSIYRQRYHKPGLRFTESALNELTAHDWPGNVRELKNLIERLALLSREGPIDAGDLPEDMRLGGEIAPRGTDPDTAVTLDEAVRQAKTQAILRAFAACGGDRTKTAERLDISPRTLRHLVRELGIRKI